jgi:hypothetical protein
LRPVITVDCPKECGSERAFFMQIQIRSADEPSTTFYKSVLELPFVDSPRFAREFGDPI